MKPISNLRNFLALIGSSMLASSFVTAQTTYTWTQTAAGNQDWNTAGSWDINGIFQTGAINELRFFAGITAPTNQLGAGASQVVINIPTSLSMNTLTLNGIGPNNTVGSSITIGTSASTWTIGNGTTTSTVNLNSVLGGGGADRDLRYTIGANLTLAGNGSGITTFTGNSTSGYGATFSGDITGSGQGITKSGSSLLVFSGNNSYTGMTSVTGGVLRLSSANALSGGIGTTGGTSALTINGGVVELGAGDFSRGLGTGSSQFQITGGTSGFSAYGGPRVITVNGDASEELVWGGTHFAPTTLVLNQLYGFHSSSPVYPNGSIELANKIDLNGTTRTVQVGANIALLSGDIRNTGFISGLIKTGSGTLVLAGNNSYDGPTTVSAGTLSIGAANNLGNTAQLSLNGGTVQITGTSLTNLTGLATSVSFENNAKGFDIHNAANTFTVNQAVSGTTFAKSGVGTLVLNQNNTFTGATTATGGGTLVLDYTTNNGSKLSDTAGLTLSGTALVLKGGSGAGANHAEVVSSTSLTTYTSNSISRDGGTSTISLGAIATTLNSTLSISESGLATTTSVNVNGILTAGRVTVGSHFAANDGSNNIVAYSGYTAATTAGGGNANVVHQLTGGGTMTANLASYSLRIANGGSSDILNLGTRNINLTNNTVLLYAGGFDNQYTINGTGFITSASGNQPFAINTYDGTTLTLNVRTSSNGAAVAKAGKGTLVIGADNSNNGSGVSMSTFYAQEGVTRLINSNALGTTAAGTIVQGGAALELANNVAIGAETLSLNGAGIFDGTSHRGALRNQSGDNSWAGAITIGASGARINSDVGTSLTLTGGIVTTVTQDVTFGGAGNTIVSTAAISGSGSVIKDGAGILTLSADNTYFGNTTVSAGKLLVNNTTGSGTGTGLVSVGVNATLGGSGTIAGATTIAGNLNPGNSPGLLSFGSSLTLETTAVTTMEINGLVRGTEYDAVNATGQFNYAGDLILQFGTTLVSDATFNLFDFGSQTGSLDTVTLAGNYTGSLINNGSGVWSLTSGNNSWVFNQSTGELGLTVAVIPEPKAALLGTIGLMLLLRRRR